MGRLGYERYAVHGTDVDSGIGYLHIQATRPVTLAYALSDSPVGQLAWIVDRVWATTDATKATPRGRRRPRPAADQRLHILVHKRRRIVRERHP